MSRLLGTLSSLLIVVILVFALISAFTGESFKTLEVEYPDTKTVLSKRVRQTHFSFPLSHLAGYNYFWLNAASGGAADNIHFTNVDSRFYRNNNLTHASFEVVFSGVLNPDMSYDAHKLEQLLAYFKKIRAAADANGLAFSDAQFASHTLPEPLRAWQVNHADSEGATVQKALQSQMAIAHAVLNLGRPALAADTKAWQAEPIDVTLELGFVDKPRRGAKSGALRTVARNIFRAWRAFEKEKGGTNLRVLLRNSSYSDIASVQRQIESGDKLVLGEDLADLVAVRRYLIQYNNAAGRPIKGLSPRGGSAGRIGYALDMSSLVSLWYAPGSDLYKDANDKPLNHTAFVDAVASSVLRRSYRGVVTENPVQLIYASFNALPDSLLHEKDLADNKYLPFSRAENAGSVDRQLRLLKSLFVLSAIGENKAGHIVFHMPRREMFPLLHRVVKPFLKDDRYYYKRNGADRWEQEYSVRLVRNYLAANVR